MFNTWEQEYLIIDKINFNKQSYLICIKVYFLASTLQKTNNKTDRPIVFTTAKTLTLTL